MAPAARLDLEPLHCGALHDRCDLIRASGTRYRRRGDAEGSVVWLRGRELVDWALGQRVVCASCECIGEAGLERGGGFVFPQCIAYAGVNNDQRRGVGVEGPGCQKLDRSAGGSQTPLKGESGTL